MLEDSQGRIWLGTDNGLAMLEGGEVKIYTTQEGLSSNSVFSLLESSTGAIWIWTYGGGVDVFQSGSFLHYGVEEGLSNNFVWSLLEDSSGAIWIGTNGGGVDVFESGSFLHYGEEEGLSNNIIRSLLESSTGAIWIGTLGGGVDVFESGSFLNYGIEEGLSSNSVWSLFESSTGAIWIGTLGGGVDVFESGSFLHYGIEEGSSSNSVRSLLESSTGAIWIGTLGGGVDVFESGSFLHYGIEEGLSSNRVYSLLESATGAIWIGTDGGGVSVFESGRFTHYGTEEGLSSNSVFCLLKSSTGAIWIGTDEGVDIFESGRFTHYGSQEGLSSNSVLSLLESATGSIWIGTYGGGVDVFESGSFLHYGTQQGLADDAVLQLAMDSLGNIWAGTGKGLTRFVAKEEGYELTSWNKSHGLKYMDFNGPGNSMLFTQTDQVSKKGTMMGSVGQVVTTFEPPLADTLKPVLFLTGIDIGQKQIDWSKVSEVKERIQSENGINPDTLFFPNSDSVLLLSNFPPDASSLSRAGIHWSGTEDLFPYFLPQNLELLYHQNHLTFHYSGMKLNEQFDVVYRYMLEGLDEDWSPFTKEGKADYRNIPHGNYTFKVRARGRNFLWSDEASISFVVHPPFWLTSKVYVSYFITSILLVILIVKLYNRRLIRHRKYLARVVKKRTVELVQQNKEIKSQAKELTTQAEELKAQNEENIALNDQLEVRVKERTTSLEESNKRLIEYAYNNAHMIRGPLARLLGLTYISKISRSNDVKDIKELIIKIEESGIELDDVIRELGKKLTEETGINPLDDSTEE